MRRLRLGVVGVGYVGELHARKYASMEDIDLAGLADIDFERAKDIARKYNTKAYNTHSELLSDVDGLSLAVPTTSHFEIGHDILTHGTHLLVEKPIALNLGDADRLIEMAKKNNTILQIGHIERFNPAVVKMESLLSKPIFIESHRLSLFTKRGTDVDVVLDLMIHDLDIILHLVNSGIKEIDAVGMPVIDDKIDIANVRIIFANGTVANLTASRVSNESLRMIRIFQPDSCISVDYGKRKISVTQLKGERKNATDPCPIGHREDKFPDSDPLADQIRSFVEAIKGGTEPKVSGVDGKKALAVALSIIDQIKGKARITS
ncbi:MAG: Gfo/Idh/MocA family oxidoreductase [Deltaproteobacteria bacterium]|jgi:predicted dehydrogenase|nr:MAG: Gfo/Idh/MocA family oxidoreductase [Deltaproteobacteria bacterium]